jgi:hypothetical protein
MPRSGKETHTDSTEKLYWQLEDLLANGLLSKQVLLVVTKLLLVKSGPMARVLQPTAWNQPAIYSLQQSSFLY